MLSLDSPIVYNIAASAEIPEDSSLKPKRSTNLQKDTHCDYSANLSQPQVNDDKSFEGDLGALKPAKVALTEISGFSADAAWKPSFVLAPRYCKIILLHQILRGRNLM